LESDHLIAAHTVIPGLAQSANTRNPEVEARDRGFARGAIALE
jgi:hypothetical protein